MTKSCNEPGNGSCRICLRDLFRFGWLGSPICEPCALMQRRHPGVDPTTIRNGRTEVLPQERASDDPKWASGAACQGAPVELFEFRLLPSGSAPRETRQAAEVFCAWCPIRERCRSEADAHEFVGLWAGQWRRYSIDERVGTGSYIVRDLIDDTERAA